MKLLVTGHAVARIGAQKSTITTLPTLDNEVTYKLYATNNYPIKHLEYGSLNIKNAKFIDTLPPEAVFVWASNNGSYDSSSNIVTWDMGDFNIGDAYQREVIIKYPTAEFEGKTVMNFFKVTGNPLGIVEARDLAEDSVEHSFNDPQPEVNQKFRKTSSTDRVEMGQDFFYFFENVNNSGNVPLSDFTLIDELPAGLKLYKLDLTVGNKSAIVQYKTDNNSTW